MHAPVIGVLILCATAFAARDTHGMRYGNVQSSQHVNSQPEKPGFIARAFGNAMGSMSADSESSKSEGNAAGMEGINPRADEASSAHSDMSGRIGRKPMSPDELTAAMHLGLADANVNMMDLHVSPDMDTFLRSKIENYEDLEAAVTSDTQRSSLDSHASPCNWYSCGWCHWYYNCLKWYDGKTYWTTCPRCDIQAYCQC